MKHPSLTIRAAIITLVVLVAAPVYGGTWMNVTFLLANQKSTQDETYRERDVLDPETGAWVPAGPDAVFESTDPLGRVVDHLARHEPRAARELLQEWLEENPDDERYFDAVFLLGETWFAAGDFYQAYEQYELVVENTGGELFDRALARERDVALAFLSGKKRIVWKILRLPAYDEAIEILDRIWERSPGSVLGEEALRIKADYFFNSGQMDLAQDEYAHLAQEYPGGKYAQFAMLRSAEAAEAEFAGIRFDDRPLLEAGERYRQVQAAFPGYAEHELVSERTESIRQRRADKDLDIARWYQRTRQPAAAEFYYRAILRDWPGTLAAVEARRELEKLGLGQDLQEGE